MIAGRSPLLCGLTGLLAVVLAAPPAPAAEKKVIAYLGLQAPAAVDAEPVLRAAIERQLRRAVEMKRFDYIAVAGGTEPGLEPFLERYRDLLLERESADRPATAVQPVWADELERIAGSAFLYQLTLTAFDVALAHEPDEPFPDARVTLSGRADFYRLDLSNPLAPQAEHVARAEVVTPETAEGIIGDQERLAIEILPLVERCAGRLGAELALRIRRLPQFALRSPVAAAGSGRLRLELGRRLGVTLGDTFEIRAPGGQPPSPGWARVIRVEPEHAVAALVTRPEGWQPGAEATAVEYAMKGVGLSLAPVAEWTFSELLGRNQTYVYPGLALAAMTDIGSSVAVADFWLRVDADYLFLQRPPGYDFEVGLGHVGLGFLKRWIFGRWGLRTGAGVGMAYYVYPDDEVATDEDGVGAHLSFGGDLILGLDLFINRWLSLVLDVRGRYFGNPLDWLPDAAAEAGLQARLAVLFSF